MIITVSKDSTWVTVQHLLNSFQRKFSINVGRQVDYFIINSDWKYLSITIALFTMMINLFNLQFIKLSSSTNLKLLKWAQ